MIKVLTLDLGKTNGYCSLEVDDLGSYSNDPDRSPDFSTLEIGNWESEHDDQAELMLDWVRWLDQRLDEVNILAFEEVNFNRGFSYIPFQMGHIQAECVRRNISYLGVNVSTLKSWATGSGNAKKKRMIAAAHDKLRGVGGDGFQPLTDDEADAFLVMMWTLENAL